MRRYQGLESGDELLVFCNKCREIVRTGALHEMMYCPDSSHRYGCVEFGAIIKGAVKNLDLPAQVFSSLVDAMLFDVDPGKAQVWFVIEQLRDQGAVCKLPCKISIRKFVVAFHCDEVACLV